MSESNVNNEGGARPTFLTVLCILSFIGGGIGVLGGLLGIVAVGAMGSMFADIPGMGAIIGASTAYMVMALLIAGASLYGAIQMWKLKKQGFYIYTGAQVVSLILPMVMLPGAGFNGVAFLFTALFIGLYAMNLKHMS